MNINPKMDGIDHINIYSKGLTWLGRNLSNFSYSPIETEDGHFDSIEGYWYWLSSKDDRLRNLSGWKAKEYGRNIGVKYWLDDDIFKNKIKKAILIKIHSVKNLIEELKKNKLPLKHYYVYGDKIIQPKETKWVVDYIESLR